MAYENIPVVGSLPDIVAVYNIAPWLFDGAILCAIFGLLFRELFKKAKITEDKNESLGGIVGFSIGLILLIGMYRKGWQLIDIWPWLLIAIIAIGAVLLWKFLSEITGQKGLTGIFVTILAVLVAGMLLGSMPEFVSTTLGWWGGLLIRLAIWLALIGLCAWFVVGAVSRTGGGGGAGGGGWGSYVGNLLKRGAAGVGDLIKRGALSAGGLAKKGALGAGGLAKKGLLGTGGLLKQGALGLGGLIKKAVSGIRGKFGKAKQAAEGAEDAAKRLAAAIKAAKEAAENFKQKKDALMKDLASIISGLSGTGWIRKKPAELDDAQIKKYQTVIAAYLPLIQDAYKKFSEQQIIAEFERCHREYDKVETAITELITVVRLWMSQLRDYAAVGIAKIKDAGFSANAKAAYTRYWDAVALMDQNLTKAHDNFEKDIKEAIKDANLKGIETLLVQISDAKKELDALLSEIAVLFGNLVGKTGAEGESIKKQIQLKCTEAVNKCAFLNTKLDSLVKDYLSYIGTAQQAFENALKQDVNAVLTSTSSQFEAIIGDILKFIDSIDAQLRREEAETRVGESGIAEVAQILETIKKQKDTLQILVQYAEKITLLLFSKMTAVKKIPRDKTAAENIIKQYFVEARNECRTEVEALRNGEDIAKRAINQITTATSHLETRLRENLVTITEKPMLEKILKVLQAILKEEKELDKLVQLLSNQDEFVMAAIRERINNPKLSLTMDASFDMIFDDITKLKEMIKQLGEVEAVLHALEQEEIELAGPRQLEEERILPI